MMGAHGQKRGADRWRGLALGTIAVLGLALVACGSGSSSGSAPTAHTTGHSGAVGGPLTPTPFGANPCGAQSTNANVAGILASMKTPVPAGATVVDQGFGRQILAPKLIHTERVGVCAQGTPGDILAFYQKQMPNSGWAATAEAPTLANAHAPCASAGCWTVTGAQAAALVKVESDDGMITAIEVSLDSLKSAGSQTEYTLKIVNYYDLTHPAGS